MHSLSLTESAEAGLKADLRFCYLPEAWAEYM